MRYNPSRGYYWEFPDDQPKLKGKEEGEGAGGGGGGAKQSAGSSSKEEQPSEGQRRRVDTLLSELMRKFPPKAFAAKKDLQGIKTRKLVLVPLVFGQKLIMILARKRYMYTFDQISFRTHNSSLEGAT